MVKWLSLGSRFSAPIVTDRPRAPSPPSAPPPPPPPAPRSRRIEDLLGLFHEDVEQLLLRRAAAGVAQPVSQRAPNLPEREARQPPVEHGRHARDHVPRQLGRHLHENGPRGTAPEDQHQQQALA